MKKVSKSRFFHKSGLSSLVLPLPRRGFTLIELVVIIAIIAIVSGIILVAVGKARNLAWDSRRKTDIVQLARVLESYNLDYGIYPRSQEESMYQLYVHENLGKDPNYGADSSLISADSTISIPKDPVEDRYYILRSTEQEYQLRAVLSSNKYYLAQNDQSPQESTPIDTLSPVWNPTITWTALGGGDLQISWDSQPIDLSPSSGWAYYHIFLYCPLCTLPNYGKRVFITDVGTTSVEFNDLLYTGDDNKYTVSIDAVDKVGHFNQQHKSYITVNP